MLRDRHPCTRGNYLIAAVIALPIALSACRSVLFALVALFFAPLLSGAVVRAANAQPAQIYFLPMPEAAPVQVDLINSNGLADPGDTIVYTVTLRNASVFAGSIPTSLTDGLAINKHHLYPDNPDGRQP